GVPPGTVTDIVEPACVYTPCTVDAAVARVRGLDAVVPGVPSVPLSVPPVPAVGVPVEPTPPPRVRPGVTLMSVKWMALAPLTQSVEVMVTLHAEPSLSVLVKATVPSATLALPVPGTSVGVIAGGAVTVSVPATTVAVTLCELLPLAAATGLPGRTAAAAAEMVTPVSARALRAPTPSLMACQPPKTYQDCCHEA